MKKSMSFFFALALLLSLCVCSVEAASFADFDTEAARASDYFVVYSTNATSPEKGKIAIDFGVFAKRDMQSIGAKKIVIQEKNGSTWTDVATKNGTIYNGLLDSNVDSYSSTYTYAGTSGKTYRAIVTVYAKDALGDDSRTVTTNSVVAK